MSPPGTSTPADTPAAGGPAATGSDVRVVDTLLAGFPGLHAAYLVPAERPAIVDAGAQTSAGAVIAALEAAGIGRDDLAYIVLTHIHLDHCGATGALAAGFPNARVVVHRRGARHLPAPERLVSASHVVYGVRAAVYGGLDAVPEERIDVAPDGHRVDLGGGRALVMIEALGHARHHMAVLDEGTGTVFAGDAVGMGLPDAGLYPTLPPSDIDVAAGQATLARLAELAPTGLGLGHFGMVADPLAAIAEGREQLALAAEAATRGWARTGTVEGVGEELAIDLPPAETIGDARALGTLSWLGWIDANAAGMATWAEAQAEA